MSPLRAIARRAPKIAAASLLLLTTAVGSLAAASPAEAAGPCNNYPYVGGWVSRENIPLILAIAVTCGPDGLRADAYQNCPPSTCYWGQSRIVDRGDGWHVATYYSTIATQYVWMMDLTEPGSGGKRMWTETQYDFAPADGRIDYSENGLFGLWRNCC
jgi:hypothetical protein